MVEFVDKKVVELGKKESVMKLIDVVESEIKDKDIKFSSDILFFPTVYLYKERFRRFFFGKKGIKQEIMNICELRGITIDLKNDDYLDLAKSIGNQIEKCYGKKVEIKYNGIYGLKI